VIIQLLDTVWGQATNLLTAPVKRRRWVDLLLLAALVGIILSLLLATRQWTGVQRPVVEISLSARSVPKYLLLSLVRAMAAYAISLVFSLVVAYWAAKDPIAERILVPILDILQSIPLLSFMPLVVLAMLAIFPRSNIGIELSVVILIVTCQAWNMAFSFYQSLKTLPPELVDIADSNGFTWWQRLKWIELPFATPGLVWNSMVSVANSWFFLSAAEAFKSPFANFQLPGMGSYMQVATDQGDGRGQAIAILTMLGLVILLDQLVWKPIVAWSQRFQVDDAVAVERPDSALLRLFRRSRLYRYLEMALAKRRARKALQHKPRPKLIQKAKSNLKHPGRMGALVARSFLLLIVTALALGGLALFRMLSQVSGGDWLRLLKAGGVSLGRVLLSTFLATLWTLPVGLWIGLSPTWSRRLQSVVQVAASFPWSMPFLAIILLLRTFGVGLGVSCVLLMMVATQWYLLFNIIAGAQAIPQDLREALRSYRLSVWKRCWALYFPAIFPFLVTGWVTATGGAWNASILTEWVEAKPAALSTFGLGAEIVHAAGQNMPLLAAASLLMAAIVVLFNRLVWGPLYRLAETRYTVNH
jgi:NitT/TauT family transport system permease protein